MGGRGYQSQRASHEACGAAGPPLRPGDRRSDQPAGLGTVPSLGAITAETSKRAPYAARYAPKTMASVTTPMFGQMMSSAPAMIDSAPATRSSPELLAALANGPREADSSRAPRPIA